LSIDREASTGGTFGGDRFVRRIEGAGEFIQATRAMTFEGAEVGWMERICITFEGNDFSMVAHARRLTEGSGRYRLRPATTGCGRVVADLQSERPPIPFLNGVHPVCRATDRHPAREFLFR